MKSHALSPEERQTVKTQILGLVHAIAAQRETLTPEERQKEAQEAEEALNADKEAQEAAEREQTRIAIASLTSLFVNKQPASPEAIEKWRWENSTRPSLAACGVRDRDQIRIVNWNCKPQESKFNRVKELCVGKGAIVALCGDRGTGKTTLATQIIRERIEARHDYSKLDPSERPEKEPQEPGRYEKLAKLAQMFKGLFASFGGIDQDRAQVLYGSWVRLPFLVIDEIHDAENIGPASTLLVDLIDQRYSGFRDTVLISNRTAEAFSKETNPSIVSRLMQHGAIIKCDWPSWRTAK